MATTDVLTDTEARAALGLDASTPYMTALVSAVSAQLDEMCGPIVQRTITSESHDGGDDEIYLRVRPVVSVTAAVEYRNTVAQTLSEETNTSKSGYDYLLEAQWGVLRRRSSNWDAPFPTGRRNIVVTYVAGRYADTASVGAKFKQAAALMLRNVWVSEQATGSETFGALSDPNSFNPLLGPGMLNKVAALLAGEMQAPNV